MFRVANLVMVVALLLTAAVVYQLKYASTAEAERLASLRSQIRKERDTIAVLKAEWARRTSPIYIQGLVQRHLDLKRLDVEAISSLNDLPERPAGGGDGIGGMIEALVDAPLVTSSVSKQATSPSTASGGTLAVPANSALRPPSPPPSRPTPRPQAPRPAPSAAAPAAPVQAEPAPVAQAPQPNPIEQFFSWARQPIQPAPAAQPAPQPAPAAPSGGGGSNGLLPMLPPGALPGAR